MPESNACTLEVVTDGKSRTITLDEKVVTFGRSRKNTVPLRDDGKVSAEHCQVVRQKDAWMLIDCGSKNKTFLNGTSISVSALKHGDSFKIGKTEVTFRVGAPLALDPKEAEKLLAAKPTSNDQAGQAIATALAAPAKPAEPRAAKKSSGLREAVRVERGSKGVSAFAMTCFFVAGILSGLTALSLIDNRGDQKPKTPVAKLEQRGPVEAAAPKEEPKTEEPVAVAPKEEPKTEEPVAVAPKEEPKTEVPVAVVPKEEPKKEEPATAKPPPDETPEPVTVRKDPVPPPPPASEDPPAASDPVTAKPPTEPPPPASGGGTTVEPPDDPARPPTQFMGLKTMIKRVVFVMDVTGSMEDPASVTPAEFSGPPEIKIGAELKRQLEKFNRKDVKTKLDAAKYELTHSIAYLHPDVEFTVIFYSFSPTPWQKRLVPANEKNKIDAIKRIKTTSAWGGTNIYDALESAFGIIDDHRKALKKPATPGGTGAKGKPEYAIFLVTDGRHNTGRFPDPEEFLSEIRKMNKDDRALINTIGVGQPGVGVDPPDPVFLARLASENGGEGKMLK
ncbi:MAG: FHA domain-containing protein [Planctomycetia bacterium]|nr:FHA domain-containing protein [Planctomycetia bacterium]